MTRMYDRPTLGPDGWIVDETPTPALLTWSLDASGNPVGLVGPGGQVQPYVGIADRHRMLNDQPYGITRAVRNPGKLVARFVDAEITVNNGAPAHADHTGYDVIFEEKWIN